MSHEDRVNMLAPVAHSVRPVAEMRRALAVESAIDDDGGINPGSLRTALPWQARDFDIRGEVTVGDNVAPVRRIRQPSRLVYLDVAANVPPSGGPLTAVLRIAGGPELERFSLPSGQSTGTISVNRTVPAGSLLQLDIQNANGAEDVSMTAWLTVHYTAGGA